MNMSGSSLRPRASLTCAPGILEDGPHNRRAYEGGVAVDAKALYVTDDAGAVHALDIATGASMWKQDKLAGRAIGGPQIVGDHVGVVDAEGWLHLLAAVNGAYVGRIASDGSPPTSQPVATVGGAAWQSRDGTLYAVRVR